MAPPRGRGHPLIEDRSNSAVHAALLTSLMTALARLLRRFLLAATLLLLTGLLPAATLLLTRARIALLRLARLRLVRIAHILSPACWLPQRALTLTRGTAESCDAKRPIARAKLGTDTGANFAKVPPRTESAFTPAYKRDRGRRARDRWARRAPFRPRRKTRCGSRPI